MFLLLMNLLVFAVIIYVAYIQVFVPIQRGTPLFPFFTNEGGLWSRLRQARQRTVEKKLETEAKKEERRK